MRELDGFAKINLCLSIVGKRGNKHLLDSLFVPFYTIQDRIKFEKSDDIIVEYTDGRVYSQDTAVLTARAIKEKYHTNGARFLIEKGIPEGAGLGGSSADAGCVARAMRILYNLPDIDRDLLLSVGSDVPYFYEGGIKRVKGIGEITDSLDIEIPHIIVLVPISCVNTGDCYRLYDEIGGNDGCVDDFIKTLQTGKNPQPFNALQQSAEILNPEIKRLISLLTECEFACGMSGSGSAVFGFETNIARYNEKVKKVLLCATGCAVYTEKEYNG